MTQIILSLSSKGAEMWNVLTAVFFLGCFEVINCRILLSLITNNQYQP